MIDEFVMNKIKEWFKKPSNLTAEEVLSKMEMSLFYGAVGQELYYYNPVIKQPILTLRVKRSDVRIMPTNDMKKEYINNIGILNLSKAERIRLYQLVEDWMIENIKKEEIEIKKRLLNSLGLTEQEFVFLIQNCKDKIEGEE